MERLNFVPCVFWVKRGVSKEIPDKFQPTEEHIKSKIDEHKQKLQQMIGNVGADEEMIENQDEDKEIIDRYNLDNYDEDEEENEQIDGDIPDPYLDRGLEYSDDEEERDDFQIKPDDNLILAGHVEEDMVSLEVKVYNQNDGIYVHHEIYLEAYPLCFQWLNYKNSTEKGNLVAVGDMKNDIKIWDLDLVDSLDPYVTLVGHKNSVLDFSWSENIPHILASGSADQTCLIWNLEQRKFIENFNIFNSNVQSIVFHPIESNILLTGDSNGNAKLINCQSKSVKNWKVCRDEIEKVCWNPKLPYTFICASSTGQLYYFDCRNEKKCLFSVKAHSDTISGTEFSSSCKGCLVTSSSDKLCKIWNVNETEIKLVHEFNPGVGQILSLAANPDLPFIYAISGDNIAGNFKVEDISIYSKVKNEFQQVCN